MVRLVLIAAVLALLTRALWRLLGGVLEGFTVTPLGRHAPARGVKMVRDPVCGTFVLPERAVTLADHGRAVHFCSTTCRDRYQLRPA